MDVMARGSGSAESVDTSAGASSGSPVSSSGALHRVARLVGGRFSLLIPFAGLGALPLGAGVVGGVPLLLIGAGIGDHVGLKGVVVGDDVLRRGLGDLDDRLLGLGLGLRRLGADAEGCERGGEGEGKTDGHDSDAVSHALPIYQLANCFTLPREPSSCRREERTPYKHRGRARSGHAPPID